MSPPMISLGEVSQVPNLTVILYPFGFTTNIFEAEGQRNLEYYNTLMLELVKRFLDIKYKYFLNPFSTKLSPKRLPFLIVKSVFGLP